MSMEPGGLQPLIQTERFDLRPLRVSDEGLMSLYAGDARVARMTRSIPHPLPPGAIAAMIARAGRADRAEDIWAIDSSRIGGAEVIGVVTLKQMDRAQSEIAFWVAPAFWNSGVASAAVQAMVAANPHGAHHLFAEVFQDNPASARVLTNSGFQYLGDAEAFSVARAAKLATWTYSRKLA